jgi:hypothetical protein
MNLYKPFSVHYAYSTMRRLLRQHYEIIIIIIVTCSDTGDAVRIVTSFITTSLAVTIISFTMCADPLTMRLGVVLVPLLWSFDILWSASLIFPDDLLCWSASICLLWSVRLSPRFYFLPPWNRVLAPQIKDTLSKGYFSSVRCLG